MEESLWENPLPACDESSAGKQGGDFIFIHVIRIAVLSFYKQLIKILIRKKYFS